MNDLISCQLCLNAYPLEHMLLVALHASHRTFVGSSGWTVAICPSCCADITDADESSPRTRLLEKIPVDTEG